MELSAAPPTRHGEGSTPSDQAPSMTEVDLDPRKYRRSAFIPDYRESMFQDEPQHTHEVPFAPSAAASVRHSVWSAEPQNDVYYKSNGKSTTSSRRNSIAPVFAKKAAEASDANSMWRYSKSQTDLTKIPTNGTTATRRKSTAPIFAQKAAEHIPAMPGAENGAPFRKTSPGPGPLLKSKSGLVYGNSTWQNADAPVLSPTSDGDGASINSFMTARENRAPERRRYSDGAGLTNKKTYPSYAVQEPMPLQKLTDAQARKARRYSDLSALNGRGHNSPRNVSPVDSRRSVAMGQVNRSGAVSPVTVNRSNSPLGSRPRNGTTTTTASGIISPISNRASGGFSGANSIRSGSPGMSSPLARNSMMAAPPGPTTTGAAVGQHFGNGQKLSLNTQVGSPPQQRPQPSAAANGAPSTKKSPTPPEAEEEMDEVIALSPAARAPIQNFRRSRASLLLSPTDGGGGSGTATPKSSTMSLNGVMQQQHGENEGGGEKRYFGQAVNMDDLVAVNLENAFDRL